MNWGSTWWDLQGEGVQNGLDGLLVGIDQEGQWAIDYEGPPETHAGILRCLGDRQHVRGRGR